MDSTLTNLLIPIKTDKIRLGPKHDGGYVVAKNYLSPNLYSYGVGSQCGFEESYNKLVPDCKMKLFDGTVKSPNSFLGRHKNAKFFQKNVYNEKDLGIEETNVFVQMDIEGAEIDIFNTMSIRTIQKVKQLCLEVHLWRGLLFEKAEQFFKKLNKYFYLVHVHGNNYSKNKKSFGLPIALELTYVNKLQWIDSITTEDKHCPVRGLDFPNKTRAKDLLLAWWIDPDKRVFGLGK